MKYWRSILPASCFALAASMASAAPSVFVKRAGFYAWWNSPMEARILGKQAGPITAAVLSKYVHDTVIYSPYEVCSLEAVANDTFVGLDRETQTEIDATKPHVAWQVQSTTPDGREVLAQSVVFEACDQERRGAALLVSDIATGEILRWEPMGDRTTAANTALPTWVMFLSAKDGDELFSYSSCTECGARTFVYYDVTRKAIYTEYNGH